MGYFTILWELLRGDPLKTMPLRPVDRLNFLIETRRSGVWNKWRRAHKGERLDLRGLVPTERNLEGFDLSNANLSGVSFEMCWLSGGSLENSQCDRVNFCFTDLVGVNLKGCDLRKAFGIKAHHLVRASFVGAKLSQDLLDEVCECIREQCS